MIKAHVNYPGAHITIHHNPNCADAKVKVDQKQRHILLNADTLSKELTRFRNNAHQLSAEAGMSDLWLVLDFQDPEFEKAIVSYLKRLVGRRFDAMENCELRVHC